VVYDRRDRRNVAFRVGDVLAVRVPPAAVKVFPRA